MRCVSKSLPVRVFTAASRSRRSLLGERLHVALGDRENYDVIATLSCNGFGVLWMGSHLALLPRSRLVRAGQHPVGWLGP